jgi:hypothetical protein
MTERTGYVMNYFRGITKTLVIVVGMLTASIAMGDKPLFPSKKGESKKSVSSKKSSKAQASKKKSKKSVAKKSRRSSKSKVARKKPKTVGDKLALIKEKYRLGEIKDKQMWVELARVHEKGDKLSSKEKVSLLQMQATLLLNGGYPISAGIIASQAIKVSSNANDRRVNRSWEILKRVSEDYPVQNLLEILADKVKVKNNTAPEFGSDWNYFVGNALASDGKDNAAIKAYSKLKLSDRYFFPGKYQQAMIRVDQDRLQDAIVSLKAILYPTSHKMSPLAEQERRQMADYSLMALGRIFYEKKEFLNAARMYRSVSKDSISYYDSLFEQSWAFFMAGFPSHALGALHSVESPFYAKVFNPEAPVLRSLTHYWLCRYDDSRNALADFLDEHSDGVEALEGFLDRQRLTDETAYALFENLISGVSSKSLGIPREVLLTASESDSLLLVRDQFAAVITERRRLEAKGVFGTKSGTARSVAYMNRWEKALRKDLGKKFLRELKSMKKDFDRLYAQAQFLYVELLMSEKDKLLGKDLHASSKITKVAKKMDIHGWGNKTQAWKDADNGEYWWDEVGFFINPVQSQCSH